MYLHVPQLLNPDLLREIQGVLAAAVFTDGRTTAGALAQGVKHNLQVDWERTPGRERLQSAVMGAISESLLVRAAILPRKVMAPLFNKHGPGMNYGAHMDNPIQGGRVLVRTDVSVTVFLSDPASYQGGELVMATPLGEARAKLPAGNAVFYPSNSLHRGEKVTTGERLAAVTWVQSMVADPNKRELLHDVDAAYRQVAARDSNCEEAKLLLKTYGNLVRMWAEA